MSEHENELADASRLIDEGRNDEALAVVDRVIQAEPESVKALLLRGRIARLKSDIDAALQDFTKIVEIDPHNAEGHNYRGRALQVSGQLVPAMNEFQEAVKLAPDSLIFHQDLADALFVLDRIDDAIAHTATLQDPVLQAGYRDHVGNWLRTLDRSEEALTQYQEAVKLAPNNPTFHQDLADALFDLDRIDDAIREAASGLKLHTDENSKASGHNYLGDRLRTLDRSEEALTQYQEAVKLAPNNPTFHQDLADALFDLDRIDDAIREAASGLELRNDENSKSRGHNYLGYRLQELGRSEEAFTQYQEAVKLAPDDLTYHQHLATTLFDLGRIEDAIAHTERLQDPVAQAGYRHHVGDRLRERGRSEEALAQYEEAVKLAPDDPTFHEDLADALFDLDRVEDAIAHAETLQGPVVQAAYRDRVGDRLRERGRNEEALVHYRAAMKLNPDNVAFHRHLTDVLFDLDRHEEALREYRASLDRNPLPLTYYARMLALLGRHKEAYSTYRRALSEASEYELADVLLQMSDFFLRQRNVEAAIRLYTSAIDQKKSDKFSLRLDLALLYSNRLGRYDDGLRELQIAAQSRPSDSELAMRTGNILLYNLGRANDAVEAFEGAVSSGDSGRLIREISLADALARAGQWARAKELFENALGTAVEPQARYTWGNALIDEQRYSEAVDQYSKCPRLPRDAFYIGCRHNLAWTLERQYDYIEARQEWKKVLSLYQAQVRSLKMQDASGDVISSAYTYMATISYYLERYDDVVHFLDQAITYDPISVSTLVAATTVYVDMRDRGQLQRHETYWRARESCNRAYELVQEHAKSSPGAQSTVQEQISVAEALLALEDYATAERLLRSAAAHAKNDSYFELTMGVLRAAQQDYGKAAKHFRQAVSLDPANLKAQSNLAESLLKLGNRSEAEEVYRQVLRVSDRHVESLLGLAEVYTAMGDAGEESEDNYTRAIDYFSRALEFSDSRQGSKTLDNREKSAALYSRGYARAKLFDSAGSTVGNSYLFLSLEDFQKSRFLDPELDKAKLAVQRAEERLRQANAERISQRVGPSLVGSLAVLIFGLAQVSFFVGAPFPKISASYHATLTFGSLIFVIASLYLPSLLRIKLAGIELEKKPVEQIGTSKPLGISR